MADQEWMLRDIRGTRADPPALAADDSERRAIYGAGLEQFEQLLIAARDTPPSARPLPLFYALNQAGRAIVAARGDNPRIDGHGLSQDRSQPRDTELLHRRIKRKPSRDVDAFGAVSRAIGSPDLSGSAEMGALWVALPGVHRIPESAWREDWRPALTVLDYTDQRAIQLGMTVVTLMSFSGNPLLDEIETLRDRYPSLPSDTRLKPLPHNEGLGPGSWEMGASWKADRPLEAVATVDPSDSDRGSDLHPTLPGQGEVLDPLMMWWIFLFGLSIFARYEPELWMKVLDVEKSQLAVPLEAVLQRALVAVPALLHQELLVNAT